jgi:hypothetical protein
MTVEKHKLNSDWYRLVYTRAALRLNIALKARYENVDLAAGSTPPMQDEAQRAQQDAKRLLLAAGEVLRASGESGVLPRTAGRSLRRWGRRRGTRNHRAGDDKRAVARSRFLLDTLVPSAAVLLAGAMDASGAPTPGEAKPAEARPGARTTRRLGRRAPIDVLRPEHVDRAKADDWVAYVEGLDRVPYRARYNLACLYTQRNDLAEAARQLERAIDHAPIREQRRLAVQAGNDYSLAPLRRDKDVGPKLLARLKELIPAGQTHDSPSA